MSIAIKPAEEEHLDEITGINRQFEGQLFIRDRKDFERLLKVCRYFYVAIGNEQNILGYLTVLDENSNYSEVTFDWFKARFAHFLYAQQIAVARNAQNKGIGTALYRHLIKHADPSYPVLFCDLFIRPRNNQSCGFHTGLGFRHIDSLELKDGRILGMFELKLR